MEGEHGSSHLLWASGERQRNSPEVKINAVYLQHWSLHVVTLSAPVHVNVLVSPGFAQPFLPIVCTLHAAQLRLSQDSFSSSHMQYNIQVGGKTD